MCGLVGVVTKKSNGFSRQQQDIFTTLLFVDTLRGMDSTGVFVVNNEGDIFVAKEAGYAPRFIQTKEFEEAQRRAWGRGSAMIGHNRARTRGDVNDDNAHPFNVDDNIFLVHNGTMRGNHKKHADVEVDSHAIAHLIHEKGSVSEALSAIDAAYALIWYDMEKGELNFIRNDERPLFWMETDDAWVWASEAAMLEFAANRVANVTVVTPPTMLTEHHLQKFTLNNRVWSTSSEKVEIKKPEPPPITSAFTGQRIIGGDDRRSEQFYEDFDWDGYMASGGGGRDGLNFRDERMLRAEEWAERRREATAAQRHRPQQQHPAHFTAQRGRPVPDAVVQLLPPPANDEKAQTRHIRDILADRKNTEAARRMVADREPPEFASCESVERALAINTNKIVHYGHYSQVLANYPYNARVLCNAFDYRFVNGRDVGDGFYLYAHPFDDEDIIFRHYFSRNAATEERMIQIAGTNTVYEFSLGNRLWRPINPANIVQHIDNQEAGFVVIRSTHAHMVSMGQQSDIPH